jgi:hypothetical protein
MKGLSSISCFHAHDQKIYPENFNMDYQELRS